TVGDGGFSTVYSAEWTYSHDHGVKTKMVSLKIFDAYKDCKILLKEAPFTILLSFGEYAAPEVVWRKVKPLVKLAKPGETSEKVKTQQKTNPLRL
ncbi:5218_t:CDS:2, partial [Ambispora leptoticha]